MRRDPVEVDNWTWYYEKRKSIRVVHETTQGCISFLIPADKLRSSLARMAKAEAERQVQRENEA